MRHPRLLLLCAGLAAAALSACGGASASNDLLVVTPDPHITPQPVTDSAFACPVKPPTEGTVSDLDLAGPCAFQYLGAARCIHKTDDFYSNVQLPLGNGGSFNLNINLEHFSGSGTYQKKSQIVVQVKEPSGMIDFWTELNGTVTLAGDQSSVTIPPTALPAALGSSVGGVETVRGVLTCGS